MIEALKQIENDRLSDLLNDQSIWNSVDINYHPPRVERLWTQLENNQRFHLHIVYPCDVNESLYHPHPWPSAVHVLSGRYEMGIGYSPTDSLIESNLAVIESQGSMYYSMEHKNGWHYVRPLDGPVPTTMLIGNPWDRWSPKSTEKLYPLSEYRKLTLLEFFKKSI